MSRPVAPHGSMQRLLAGLTGLAIGAALWAALALPASVAYEMLYKVNERCYQQSLNEILEQGSEGPARGCIPTVISVVLGGARYGPAVLLLPSSEVALRAPILSGLLFAIIGGLSFGLAGRKLGILLTVISLAFIELALITILLLLWSLS